MKRRAPRAFSSPFLRKTRPPETQLSDPGRDFSRSQFDVLIHEKSRREQKEKEERPSHPEFDLRTETYKLFGVDVTQIPGLEENALPLFSEVGRDMSRWPTAAHFISWLALCPDNDISGGKLLWRGARRIRNRAGHLFRLAAFSLHSLTPLGIYLRRMKAKLGPEAATMATAHKIAVIFLHHGQKPSRI
jgi:transposase